MTSQISLAPLLAAPWAIPLHAFAAMGAFLLGLGQLMMAKGTRLHRAIGYLWLLTMAVVTISSFWIHQIRQWGDFSVIHLISIFVMIQTPRAILAARRGDVQAHRRSLLGIFIGGLVIAGGFTFLPGRIMHAVLFGS